MMRMRILNAFTGLLLSLGLPIHAQALNPGPNDVLVRVVDVGPGLCTITRVPGDLYMVYDAGHWSNKRCLDAVQELVVGDRITLMIISHADSDHHGNAADILDKFDVRQIMRTGDPRTSNTWKATNDAIGNEAKSGASIHNLQSAPLFFGAEFPLGPATIKTVAGWPVWEGTGPTPSELRNAISIVVRLEYQGKSVLFTGDTVGRRLGDPDTACKDAEKAMVDNVSNVPIRSDVMIAPHHGGNNGNSACFIAAVDPEFVIFSAGHRHDHPSAGAANRYLQHGVSLSKMFRTDRGDDEGGFEWSAGSVNGCTDQSGDDTVDILLKENGTVEVAYLNASAGC